MFAAFGRDPDLREPTPGPRSSGSSRETLPCISARIWSVPSVDHASRPGLGGRRVDHVVQVRIGYPRRTRGGLRARREFSPPEHPPRPRRSPTGRGADGRRARPCGSRTPVSPSASPSQVLGREASRRYLQARDGPGEVRRRGLAAGVRDDWPRFDSGGAGGVDGETVASGSSTAAAGTSPTWSTSCTTTPARGVGPAGCSPARTRRSTPRPAVGRRVLRDDDGRGQSHSPPRWWKLMARYNVDDD